MTAPRLPTRHRERTWTMPPLPLITHAMCHVEAGEMVRQLGPETASHIRSAIPPGDDSSWCTNDFVTATLQLVFGHWWDFGQPLAELPRQHSGDWSDSKL